MDKILKPTRDSNLLTIIAVNLGGALEWYEIGLFISWQLIIQQDATNFEASIAESINVISVLAIIALALASGGVRALGGWFFGSQGDRKGRRIAFPLTVLISSLPSFGLIVLTFFITVETWITYSTVIFTLIKFFQGIPAGGEIPGAMCYLAESDCISDVRASLNKQRYMCSYALVGPQLGLALSALVCLFLRFLFPVDFLLEKAWRFVFFYIRIVRRWWICLTKKAA
jgi:MFS transporter, MHS family, proline/betaine transporter